MAPTEVDHCISPKTLDFLIEAAGLHVQASTDKKTIVPEWCLDHQQPRPGKLLIKPIHEPAHRVIKLCGRDDSSWIRKNNRYYSGVRKPAPSVTSKRTGMAKNLSVAQYQRHLVHLMMRIFALRTGASPFTLILDDLNQGSKTLLDELFRRAMSRNINIVYLTFDQAVKPHPYIRHIPIYHDVTGDQVLAEIDRAMKDFHTSIVIVDSLHDLLNHKKVEMAALLNLVAVKYSSMLFGIWHQDVLPATAEADAYTPQTLDVIKYMATTIITCKSFAHMLAIKAAKERSLPEPTHGLLQGAEGIVQCLEANDIRGIVLEAEFRRKSGRPESGTYFLRPSRQSDYNAPLPGMFLGTLKQEFVTLLDLVPSYASKEVTDMVKAAAEEIQSTFDLGLTEKQKQARDGVVLPYYDAQKSMGDAGEGGRILYDMGSEDDFDEEEDEI
ncbi:hypothetical protein BU24DRAFT_175346 [Aaosphaeria arxii CBS 175.79]|uniref:Elongator complex protein 5 n=1 Tax=Aaosphaeria arxii CBS 175.79 TaxID=1450172 RepID=A0A6A5XPZ3_9PLEO|nr:uncharacterized protein BU24DRAFT_175346 [Aaosphaeria arxii CBS 175.79]KAF2015318.1 hypothetical protein BU24DRAFT_175346 [Aaosphaeria arxii CBS 175.79]